MDSHWTAVDRLPDPGQSRWHHMNPWPDPSGNHICSNKAEREDDIGTDKSIGRKFQFYI